MENRKQILISKSIELLNASGFNFKSLSNGLICTINDDIKYKIGYTSWPFFAQVEFNFDVFDKRIEEVKKKAWGAKYDKFVSYGQRKDIIAKKIYGIEVSGTDKTSTLEDTINAAKSLNEFFLRYAQPFLNQFVSIQKIHYFLNNNPGQNLWFVYNPVQTSFLALISAYLTNPKSLDELSVFYRRIIEQNPIKSWIIEYEILYKYLSSLDSPSI